MENSQKYQNDPEKHEQAEAKEEAYEYFPDDAPFLDDKRQRHQKRSLLLLLGTCALFVLAFFTYTKSSFHVMNCVHHMRKHARTVNEAPILAKREQLVQEIEQAPQTEACDSEACKKYAKTVLTNLSPKYQTLDPCEDFDAYTCDGFRQSHEPKSYKALVGTMELVREEVDDILVGLLNGSVSYKASHDTKMRALDQANYKAMRTVWDTCMNEDTIRAYGVKPIIPILEEFEKRFPVKGAPLSGGSNAELTDLSIWLYDHGGPLLWGAGSTVSNKDPDVHILGFHGPSLSFAKKHYQGSTALLADYAKSSAEMQQVMRTGKTIKQAPIGKESEAELLSFGNRVVDFEKYLSKRIPDPDRAHNLSYTNYHATVGELQKLVPEIDFTKYLKAIVPKEYPIGPDLLVHVPDIDYYRNLSAVFKDTPRETIHDYFRNKIVRGYSFHLQSDFTEPIRRTDNIQSGLKPDEISPRWMSCRNAVDGHLSYMESGLWVDQEFTQKDKQLGDRIVSELRAVFKKRLGVLPWLSDSAKPTALKKVDSMIPKIGYQSANPDVSNPQEIHDYYADKIKLSSNSSWSEMLNMFRVAEKKTGWEKFLKPVDQATWGSTAPTVNAFYSPNTNSIMFPAGIMRNPIFGAALPEYVSYGSFGAVAGHEITHAFDDNGSKRDDKRLIREWWDQPTKDKFHQRTQCFIDQFSNYTIEGREPGSRLNIDGKLTLSENVADAGGLSAAFEAWQTHSKFNPRLPGLERFTNEQMFFVSYGSFWCSKIRKEAAISRVYSDSHSPAAQRIIGTTANNAAFRQAFNCKVKEPTCSLW